jgi:predicted ArsR family transcriptional regulator
MSNGIAHSIQFTEKLVEVMEAQFGSTISSIAEEITPSKERKEWQSCMKEDPINTYIKNMQFLVVFLERLRSEYGDQIAHITSDLVAKEEHLRWCSARQEVADHSIDGFIHAAWEPLRALGFMFEVNKKVDGAQIHCTSCPIHQLSKMIGGAKWLAILECNKDLHNVEAFNSKIGMKRTKTLMKGDSHCDHYYYNKEE